MVDCAAMPSCARIPLQRMQSKNLFIPRNVNVRVSHRYYLLIGKSNLTCQLVSLKVPVVSDPLCIAVKGNHSLNNCSLRCCCLGALMNPENVVPSSWVSSVDEVLLVVSAILAYMAGAIPHKRTIPGARRDTTHQHRGATSSTPYGRSAKGDTESNSNDSWGEVKGKLLDALSANEHALSANEHDGNLDNKAVGSENHIKKYLLSLFALAEGPRLRLLWATLQRLQKEVSDISQTHSFVNRDVWMVVASEIIKGSIQPACINWLEEEIALEIGEPSTVFTRISGVLKGGDTLLKNIDRLGKAELYADLLFFLRFGSLSCVAALACGSQGLALYSDCLETACCYDSKFLTQHGVDILEDLVIMLADGIASIYLELISVDSSMSSEINALGLTLCTLSTRALQRLRNEVALNQWLQQNFESVVSMYEDQFELFVLCRQQLEDPIESQSKKSIWWKKLTFRKSPMLSSLNYVQISLISLPVKRTKELRALTGWRYYFSLFLEFSDITLPLVRTVFTKVSNAVSFFLVYMIGRSLGLIFSGIRQSLRWR